MLPAGLRAQTDVAVSLYGAFNAPSSGNGTTQSPSNTAGGLLEVRHRWNTLAGVEATYSYNRADQKYSNVSYPPCPPNPVSPCGPTTTTAAVPADAHEITGDWFASMKFGAFRPFVLAGGGLLLNVSAANSVTAYEAICSPDLPLPPCPVYGVSISTNTQTKGVFVYGAGVDWTVLPHLGLRLQYRGNVYKAPDLTSVFTSTNRFTHNAEPMIGAFFRF
jgi:opacity protein-like surface antigen